MSENNNTDDQINQIQTNWTLYEKFCRRLSDSGLNELLDAIGDRICMAPASMRSDSPGAYPGGLIEHALQVTSTMRSLYDSVYRKGDPSCKVTVASILKVGLLHDLGRVGDLENDYLVTQDSDWHREKLGQMYKYNESADKMSVSHRTLYLLQHFRVPLSREEWVAIQLSSGSHFEENRFYVGSEPTLALLLQQAKRIVLHRSSVKSS
jgi:hypothetical protein